MFSRISIRELGVLGIVLILIPTILLLGNCFGVLRSDHLVFIPLYFVAAFIVLLVSSYRFFEQNKSYINIFALVAVSWVALTALGSLFIKWNLHFTQVIWNILLAGLLFVISLAILLSSKFKNSGKNLKYPYRFTVLIFTLIGFILRIYNLDLVPPLTDEFYHLLAAKRYLLEGHFEYSRGIFLTYAIGFIFEILGHTSIYFARLIPVILGTATIPLIYILWKRIHPTLGLLSAVLLSLMPLTIGMSRFIREYSFYLLYLVAHLCLLFYMLSHKKWSFARKNGSALLLLVIPIYFYFFIEDSNFVPLLIIYTFIVMGIEGFHSISVEALIRRLKKEKLIFSLAGVSLFIILGFLYSRLAWLINIKIPESFFRLPELNYFDALFSPDYSPWGVHYAWFSGSPFPTFFVIGLCLVGALLFWKNRYYQIAWGIFLVTLIPFLYFADRYYAIRYIYYIIPFYILIVAAGAYTTLLAIKIFPRKTYQLAYILSIIVIGSSLFSLTPTFTGLDAEVPGKTDPKKELHGYDYQALFSKLSEVGFNDGDPIIASDGINNGLAYYLNNYSFIRERNDYPLLRYALKKQNGKIVSFNDMHEVYAYHYDVPQFYAYPCADLVCETPERERLQALMNIHPTGWFIVDKDRNKNWNPDGFPLKNFMLGDVLIKYVASTEGLRGIDIYRWGDPSQPPKI